MSKTAIWPRYRREFASIRLIALSSTSHEAIHMWLCANGHANEPMLAYRVAIIAAHLGFAPARRSAGLLGQARA